VVREKSGKIGNVRKNLIEIVATRCQILWLKYTKFVFYWRSTDSYYVISKWLALEADPLAIGVAIAISGLVTWFKM